MKNLKLLLLLVNLLFASAASSQVIVKTQSDPVLFGVSDLNNAIAEANAANVTVLVITNSTDTNDKAIAEVLNKIPARPESFVISKSDKAVIIAGSDEVGAMYGCFELAERLHMGGKKILAIEKPVIQSPLVEFRAVNPFLTLPYGKETINTWWFLSEEFWQGYIDQLARARINWIDLHGMYDIKTTDFPNLYAYFVRSELFPDAGVVPEIADRNLAMLKKVMRMANARGIKFAIMNYSTRDGAFCRPNAYKWTEDAMAEYTQECAKKLLKACPDIAMFGFRIGESGKSEDFFKKSYIPAVEQAERQVDLYTRSWLTTKDKVIELAQAFPGRLYVEIKYNGEQYGPAHIIAGGRMAGWHDYSYRTYFSYPRPYKVIFQVRTNGTSRVFPWGNPDFVARTARNSLLGGAVGLTVEPINAYYPAYDYLHKDDSPLRWYTWIYQRDWFFYDLWGRMSYDPNVPEQVWIAKFRDRFGHKAGESFYRAFITGSQIVPYAAMFNIQGPDHRDYATELETGGSVAHWADDGPFDNQNIQSPREYAESIVNNTPSARLNPLQAAQILDSLSADTIKYMDLAIKEGCDSKEFKSLCVDLQMLSRLGSYNAARLRSATYFALYRLSHDKWAAEMSRNYHKEAVSYWQQLAALGDMYFKPFVDTLRLHTEQYTWAGEAKKSRVDGTSLEDQIKPLGPLQLPKNIFEPRGDKNGPTVRIIDINVANISQENRKLTVKADVSDPAGVKAVLFKYKPLPSETLWKTIPMKQGNNVWEASIIVKPEGLMWCIEAFDKDNNGTMWPDFRNDIPYKVIESWDVNGLAKSKE